LYYNGTSILTKSQNLILPYLWAFPYNRAIIELLTKYSARLSESIYYAFSQSIKLKSFRRLILLWEKSRYFYWFTIFYLLAIMNRKVMHFWFKIYWKLGFVSFFNWNNGGWGGLDFLSKVFSAVENVEFLLAETLGLVIIIKYIKNKNKDNKSLSN
jgi:hypothetical protein